MTTPAVSGDDRRVLYGYTAAQVREAERPYLAAGVPLMARAAAGLADEVGRMLAERGLETARILVLAGSGDNGGDALYAAARLAANGHRVQLVSTGSRVHERGWRAALDAGARPVGRAAESNTTTGAPSDTESGIGIGCDLILDGIVGTGTGAGAGASAGAGRAAALRGHAREVVLALLPRMREPAHPLVVAVDIPSGIDPDTGAVADDAVLPADATVTFGAYKAGLLLSPARELAGRVVLIDIGIAAGFEDMVPAITLAAHM